MLRVMRWEEELRGKTLTSIRPQYKGEDFKPYVRLQFAGDFEYEVHALKAAYFDGCFINILRRAKPIEYVNFDVVNGEVEVEAWSKDFLLFHMSGSFKDSQTEGSPLELFKLGD